MAEQVTRTLNMSGVWWIPEKYEDRKIGTLKWMPNQGCILKLADDSFKSQWDASQRLILGLNSERVPVTLVDCRDIGGIDIQGRGNVTSYGHSIAVRCALIGILQKEESDLALTDLYAGFAGLDEYVLNSYVDYDFTHDAEGNLDINRLTYSFPSYELVIVGETKVGLFVSWSTSRGLQLQHKLHISFPRGNLYRTEGVNYQLVHDVLPAFLSAMMGHQSFLTSLNSRVASVSVEVFDGRHRRMSWDGDSKSSDELVMGFKSTFALWSKILPTWATNYATISKLCKAYVRILSHDEDGFFNINELVHVYFGLEAYYKAKCNAKSGSLKKALEYTIHRIRSYFEGVENYITLAEEIDVNSVNHARQVLVHANEGKPDYQLVFQQLMFITRCVFLMEMEYPISQIQQDTQHWSLWQFFADRRQQEEADFSN